MGILPLGFGQLLDEYLICILVELVEMVEFGFFGEFLK
jgi:hypothetical protein